MEYYSKCNVCGNIYCYTDADISENKRQAFISGMAAIGSMANALNGTRYDMYEMSKMANNASNKIVNYSKCPNCGSIDTVLVTKKFAVFANKSKGAYSIADLITESNKYLEKRDFENAFCFANMIIEEEEDNYDAHLIKLLASYNCCNLEELEKLKIDFSNNQHYLNLISICPADKKKLLMDKARLSKINKIILDGNEAMKLSDVYCSINQIDDCINLFKIEKIASVDNDLFNSLLEKKYRIVYNYAIEELNNNTIKSVKNSISLFSQIKDYKDSKDKLLLSKSKLEELEKSLVQYKSRRKKNNKKIVRIVFFVLIFVILVTVFALIYKNSISPLIKYNNAEKLVNSKKYDKAIQIYNEIPNYRDSKKKQTDAVLNYALECYKQRKYKESYELIVKIKDEIDFSDDVKNIYYSYANILKDNDTIKSYEVFNKISSYKDSQNIMDEISYQYVKNHLDINDRNTYKYIKLLKDKKYLDSEMLFNNLYHKTGELILNSNSSLEPEYYTKFIDGTLLYLHYKINGIPPEEKIKVTIRCNGQLHKFVTLKTYHKIILNKDSEMEISSNDWNSESIQVADNVQCFLYYDQQLLATSNMIKYKEGYNN